MGDAVKMSVKSSRKVNERSQRRHHLEGKQQEGWYPVQHKKTAHREGQKLFSAENKQILCELRNTIS
jgi:hypothetical protein